MSASSNCQVVSSTNFLENSAFNLIIMSDGYDAKLMKINGRFSYDQSSQRDLEFYTDIRELDLGSRLYVGEESECEQDFISDTEAESKVSKGRKQ